MKEETLRKNITLPGRYARMFKDLKRRGEFDSRFNSFSEFVQCMVEELHENPERVEKKWHENQAEYHSKRAENLQEELETKEKVEEVKDDYDWLKEKVNWLHRKGKGNGGVEAAFNDRESNLVQKYSREFDTINPRSLRKKMTEVADEEGLDVDFTA